MAQLGVTAGMIESNPFAIYTMALFILESAVFTALLGGSFGKLATRLRVVRTDGSGAPLDLLRSLLRSVLVALVIPPLVFRPDGRGLHDMVAGSATIAVPRSTGNPGRTRAFTAPDWSSAIRVRGMRTLSPPRRRRPGRFALLLAPRVLWRRQGRIHRSADPTATTSTSSAPTEPTESATPGVEVDAAEFAAGHRPRLQRAQDGPDRDDKSPARARSSPPTVRWTTAASHRRWRCR